MGRQTINTIYVTKVTAKKTDSLFQTKQKEKLVLTGMKCSKIHLIHSQLQNLE